QIHKNVLPQCKNNQRYVILAIVIIGIISFVYRINAEEKMLKSRFGEEYKIYLKKTWKLIPLIY
ncbi:MAG: hypothetical protein MJK14_03980, partial [Rivularia sp. ALOHA_DT_140]|nr:hypothetical protein [Rivularia sp. ALOHA_DT_140]